MLFCTADALEIKKAEPKFRLELSGWRDLNPRPLRPERSALPSCATARLATDVDITLWWWTMQIGMSRVLRDGGFAVCTGLSTLCRAGFASCERVFRWPYGLPGS